MNKIFTAILSVLLISACYQKQTPKKEELPHKKLSLIGKYKLKVQEPSGLSFNSKNNLLWTVSDETAHAYLITTKGELLDSFKVEGKDLEGICSLPSGEVAVLDERSGDLIFISEFGAEVKRENLNIYGEKNKGAEGVAYVPSEKSFFILKEKPPELFIYSDSFTKIDTIQIDFAEDVSGIFCDTTRNELWIISDENKLVACCTFEGKVLEKYQVDIPQIEGVTMDIQNSILYLVSDKSEYLYAYKMKESFRSK